MPRAKKKAVTSEQPDASVNPAELDTPAHAEPPAATPTADPVQFLDDRERVAAHETGHTASVQRREPHYLDQGHTDFVVGVRLIEHRNPFKSVIRFTEPVSEKVERFLAGCGFEKNPDNGEFHRPVEFTTRQQDREDARRVFDKTRKILRDERGITHEFGM